MGSCCSSHKGAAEHTVGHRKQSTSQGDLPSHENSLPPATRSASSSRLRQDGKAAGESGTGNGENWMVIPLPAANPQENIEETPVQTAAEGNEKKNPGPPLARVGTSYETPVQENKKKEEEVEDEDDGELYSVAEESSDSGNQIILGHSTSAAVSTPTRKEKTERPIHAESAFPKDHDDSSSSSDVWSDYQEGRRRSNSNAGALITTVGTVSTFVVHPEENRDRGNSLSINSTHPVQNVEKEEKEKESPLHSVVVVSNAVKNICEETSMSLLRAVSLGHNMMKKEDHTASESPKEKKEEKIVEKKTPDDTNKESNSGNALANIIRQSVHKEQERQGESPLQSPSQSAGLKPRENIIQLDTLFSDSDDENNNGAAGLNENLHKDPHKGSPLQVGGGGVVLPVVAKVKQFDEDSVHSQEHEDPPKGIQTLKGDEVVSAAVATAGVGGIQDYIDSGSSDGGSERRRLTAIVQRPAPPTPSPPSQQQQYKPEEEEVEEEGKKRTEPRDGEVREVRTVSPTLRKEEVVGNDKNEVMREEQRNHSNDINNDYGEDGSDNDVDDDIKGDGSLKKHLPGSGIVLPTQPRPAMIISPPPVTPQSREGESDDNDDIH
ncbi:uncharacterized protein TM35_000011540 [Trypanosoma theileri]|uniref:Uncharacterized protein n=1 Tax=Trypanosoma theileri TaxID=67003 RepID=A0A1X0P8K1_9TRYP|nr:uncharacterized protein TM35_000011540 [Trypanosoma theileri]ORC93277.1 hypothetical protein TM35_000011540 [Trypanosoma theileri]